MARWVGLFEGVGATYLWGPQGLDQPSRTAAATLEPQLGEAHCRVHLPSLLTIRHATTVDAASAGTFGSYVDHQGLSEPVAAMRAFFYVQHRMARFTSPWLRIAAHGPPLGRGGHNLSKFYTPHRPARD